MYGVHELQQPFFNQHAIFVLTMIKNAAVKFLFTEDEGALISIWLNLLKC